MDQPMARGRALLLLHFRQESGKHLCAEWFAYARRRLTLEQPSKQRGRILCGSLLLVRSLTCSRTLPLRIWLHVVTDLLPKVPDVLHAHRRTRRA